MINFFGNPKKMSLISSIGKISNSDIISTKFIFSKNYICQIDINRISSVKKKTITLMTKNNSYLWIDNTLQKFDPINHLWKNYFKSTIPPLKIECKNFIKCVRKNLNDDSGMQSIAVLKILEKLMK